MYNFSHKLYERNEIIIILIFVIYSTLMRVKWQVLQVNGMACTVYVLFFRPQAWTKWRILCCASTMSSTLKLTYRPLWNWLQINNILHIERIQIEMKFHYWWGCFSWECLTALSVSSHMRRIFLCRHNAKPCITFTCMTEEWQDTS